MRSFVVAALLLTPVVSAAPVAAAEDRPRLVVTTDIGGDPDDTQSLVRLLAYSNEFEIEALVATAAGTPGELEEAVTRADLIRGAVEAYGQVRGNLVAHAEGYPEAAALLERVVEGNPRRGLDAVGEGRDTAGSRRIVEVVDRNDPRPVNVAIWGGQTDFAQALWRVRSDRGGGGLAAFVAKLRVYDVDDQDGLAAWIAEEFPGLFYVLAKAPPGQDTRLGGYRGMYLGGDESLTAREWIDTHVRTGQGPLGTLYPPQTWTDPNPHAALKEGDTPSWFFFLPNGLGDPDHPEWGGWGGRFESTGEGRRYRDARDTVEGATEARATVWRWRPYFQNEFEARMDWCVKPREEANHPPRAVIDGDATRSILRRTAKAGEPASFDAGGSTDPDGGPLAFVWRVYPEAGTYGREAGVANDKPSLAVLTVPADAAGKSIHLLLEVTDRGTPPLTASRRVVIDVAE